MAEYEVVREILNECANNQMRDVFFDEIETDDPEQYVRTLLASDSIVEIHTDVKDENSLTIFTNSSGLMQRFSFTKI